MNIGFIGVHNLSSDLVQKMKMSLVSVCQEYSRVYDVMVVNGLNLFLCTSDVFRLNTEEILLKYFICNKWLSKKTF